MRGSWPPDIVSHRNNILVLVVVPGVIVDTSPRSDAEVASGYRTPTASGDREEDLFQIGFKHLRKDWWEGESGSSSSAGETIPKTLPPHTFQRDPRTPLEGNIVYSLIFRRTPVARYANAQNSQGLHAEGIWKVEKTGCRMLENFERYNHSGSLSCQKRTNLDCIFDMRVSGTRFGYSMDTQVSVQKQDCTTCDEKFAAILTSKNKLGVIYVHN